MTTATKPERTKPAPPKVFATITAPRAVWAAALARVVGVVPHKGTLEVFKCVRLSVVDAGGLELRATDLETWVSTTVHAIDITGDTPPVCVPAQLLAKAVGEMPNGDVAMRVEEGKVTLTAGKVRVKIPTMAGDEFPNPPDVSTEAWDMNANVAEFFGTAARVEHCVKLVVGSPMQGVLVERLTDGWRFSATNGQRLSRHGPEVGDALADAILPPAALTAAAKLFEGEDTVSVALDAHHVRWASPSGFCIARQILGPYPKLEYVITLKEPFAVVTCDSSELLQAVRRARLAADQTEFDFSKIVLQAEGDGFLELSAVVVAGHESGDIIGASVEGGPFRVCVNPAFFPPALKALDGLGAGQVRFSIPTRGAAAIFVRAVAKDGSSVADAFEILMPMREAGG